MVKCRFESESFIFYDLLSFCKTDSVCDLGSRQYFGRYWHIERVKITKKNIITKYHIKMQRKTHKRWWNIQKKIVIHLLCTSHRNIKTATAEFVRICYLCIWFSECKGISMLNCKNKIIVLEWLFCMSSLI